MALQRLDDVHTAVQWLRDGGVAALRTDSRQVHAGDAFLAWAGTRDDGRRHVADALAAGAARCLVDHEGAPAFPFDDARVAALPQLKASAGSIADAWYGQPSQTLEVVAVTGTNGKTSVAWWTAQALSTLGQRCGVIGTLGVGEPPKAGDASTTLRSTGLTTPDAVLLQATLADFVQQGFAACTMEASSIGIVDHRLSGTRIAVAQFTNFTRDHLDYHGDMAAYWAAKRLLFGWPGLRAAVINIDDEQGATLADELDAAFTQRGGPAVWTYSARSTARLQAQDLRHLADGMAFDLVERDTTLPVRCSLVGAYNVSNLLAVVGALRALGIGLADAVRVLPQLSPVPGRMQRVGVVAATSPVVVVDYAHTPDALEQALQALRGRSRTPAAAGCGVCSAAAAIATHQTPADGGDRDRCRLRGAHQRQPARARIRLDPVADLEAGRRSRRVPSSPIARRDRHDRVEAAAADVVLVAGKGHEDYRRSRAFAIRSPTWRWRRRFTPGVAR